MKLWDKGIAPENSVIGIYFGKDRETDLALAKWDIVASMAHVIMLRESGLISDDEKRELAEYPEIRFFTGNGRTVCHRGGY
jgi:argininosuccinate lyase